MKGDWLSIVESAYRTDLDEAAWLDHVLETCRTFLDRGYGIAALLYDASSMTSLVPTRFISRGTPDGLRSEECMKLIEMGTPDPAFLAKTFGALSCGLLSKTFGTQFPAVLDHVGEYGVADMLAVNGIDPSLHGCFLTGNLPKNERIAPRTRAMWSRVSAHLAGAYRLRRRLAASTPSNGVEAILRPSGVVDHAEGVAKDGEARVALRDAVVGLEKARGRMRRDDPDAAMSSWKALVQARWSLVDQFESDGRRYVVARCNDVTTPSLATLTARELQVVAYAALEHQNKFIAYELGIATSTVGVLLSRAAKKLGVRSRAALVSAYLSAASSAARLRPQ
jgi:DNA-binding CsgD family transcriptional regulator